MLVGVNTLHAGPDAPDTSSDSHRFLLRVIDRMRALQEGTQVILFTFEDEQEHYPGLPRVRLERGRGWLSPKKSRRNALNKAILKSKVDVLFAPLELGESRCPVPQVLYTVDLSPWEAKPAAAAKAGVPPLRQMRQACAACRAVAVPSEHMRRRCLELFELALNRAVVAPPGVSQGFDSPQASIVEPPYLTVWNDAHTGEKAHQLSEALGKRSGEFPGVLVVAGPGGGGTAADWGGHVVRVERCPDATLAGLLHHSEVFIYPVAGDSNAMRVLEALRAGALVITPHGKSVQELAGDLPFYYNPGNTGSFLQVLRRVLDMDPEERSQRVRAAQNHSSKYTWDKTVWKILAAFKRA